jgi:hypothetical protein
MNPYPAPTTITMQRPGESSVNITLEDAVVIMTNQQKTIDELIRNNQKMFQYIQDLQNSGVAGAGGVQFVQQSLSDPASHVAGTGAGAPAAPAKPMTLSEYLSAKNGGGAAAGTTAAPTIATTDSGKPMTLSEYLASKNSAPAAAAAAAASSSPASAPAASDSKLAPDSSVYTF